MRAWIVGLLGATFCLSLSISPSSADQQPVGTPKWVYGHDLKVRKGGTPDFDEKTQKIGVEFFTDETGGALLALSQHGCLAVTPLGTLNGDKKETWAFAHDLRSRAGDEEQFTDKTTKYCVEVFRDEATGKLLCVSEKGSLTFSDASDKPGKDKEPVWHHALILKVRGANEEKFDDKTKKFSVEAFKDGNTGNLIYITENGNIATAPAPLSPPAPDKVKGPKAMYGLALSARKVDEKEFGKNKIGIEVFRDENTGGLIYISETGSIATAPAPSEIKSGQSVTWKHAMVVKARPSNVKEFTSSEVKKFGIEVFMDNNTGHLVYIADNGSIAVLPAAAAK